MGFLWGQVVHLYNWGELTHLNDSGVVHHQVGPPGHPGLALFVSVSEIMELTFDLAKFADQWWLKVIWGVGDPQKWLVYNGKSQSKMDDF